MKYDTNAKYKLVDYCSQLYCDNERELEIVNEFKDSYHLHTPIWWYTRECFTYHMLNRALRTHDIKIIIRMGFFLRDLHEQIKKIYEENKTFRDLFIVYRGQGMFVNEFEKLKASSGGLLAFNNFLSTSTDRQVSLEFARQTHNKDDMVAILFQIQINPISISTPFAPLDNISYYKDEEKEILFSTHAVFRIGHIKQIESRLWQVDLISTTDTDRQLQILTEYLRSEIEESNSWDQLSTLMITMGYFKKAEEICQALIDATADDRKNELAHYYHQLGYIKSAMGDHQQALDIYQNSLNMQCNSSELNQLLQATIYNSIGVESDKMGDYSTALSFYEKAFDIRK
ncbi:unnamed protein product [Rotaria sp. Silwood2]|nr:unnamed protein product [Rotaria sp. Silwood2]CAF4505933.1 unnamed protein product [Rotaria sp. Silwood2]